ncbi:hypothetical protein NAB41_06330 [Proteus mirabilis]|uniref:phage tail fiber protein n=1 Tax=Proteus mirabilis TaxID=584 RepID=UPI002024125C|nr:hypothetical protein [Proteus mirabilis]MCL8627064.1 hypothetical protein [Proteus mirabilis]MCL8633875.1 hypothetical protein [Proteus mirabilis]
MIYTTGTVNTVSGSAIVKGTGTKFKNNNPAINIGMTILIKSGNTNIPYMIKSVNSDTELVLAHPALATATNTTFSIHITEPDNNSDAARTMVAINAYTQYFLDAMNTWMTQTGQTKIEMPNGEIVTLDSIKKMQGDIQNKADKSTTALQLFSGGVRAPYVDAIQGSDYFGLRAFNKTPSFYLSFDGVGYNINAPIKQGTMMLVGDYGLGSRNPTFTNDDLKGTDHTSFFMQSGGSGTNLFKNHGCGIHFSYNPTIKAGLFVNASTGVTYSYYSDIRIANGFTRVREIYSEANTTTDPQGFIKKASPIINIRSDGAFTTNDESEGATVARIAKGEYLIEGVLGFNSDAGWGGVDGGIEIPLDVNKQPLIWVNSKINKDGSILVKTYHRTHPNAPKFANNTIDGFNDGDPIDIPTGRFISVRVQMPEQSIYNVRMREMEEAQKIKQVG